MKAILQRFDPFPPTLAKPHLDFLILGQNSESVGILYMGVSYAQKNTVVLLHVENMASLLVEMLLENEELDGVAPFSSSSAQSSANVL